MDSTAPALAGSPSTEPATLNAAAVAAGTEASFELLLHELHPPALDASCFSGCPEVRLDGVERGSVARAEELDDPDEQVWGFRWSYTASAADWPEGEASASLSVRWEDAAGHLLDVELATPLQIDLVAPAAVCALSPKGRPVALGETLELRVDLSEAVETLSTPPEVRVGAEPAAMLGTEPFAFVWAPEAKVSDGKKDVVIHLTDVAGNSVELADVVAALLVDTTPPELALLDISPPVAKAGTTINVLLTATELLEGAPTLGASHLATDISVELAIASGEGAAANAQYSMSADGLPEGEWLLDPFVLVDLLGNEAAITPRGEGSFLVDTTPPQILSLDVVPARPRPGDTVTATVTLGEAVEHDALDVTVAGEGFDCPPDGAPSAEWGCTWLVGDDDVEEGEEQSVTVLVTVFDAAGNVASEAASLVLDARVPGVVSDVLVYEPADGNPLSKVEALGAGTTVTVLVVADELLAADATVELEIGSPLAATLVGTSTSLSAEFVLVGPMGSRTAPIPSQSAGPTWRATRVWRRSPARSSTCSPPRRSS